MRLQSFLDGLKPLSVLLTVTLLLPPAARAVDYTLVNLDPVDSLNWSLPKNWAPEGVPGSDDSASIPTSRAAFITGSISVGTLNLVPFSNVLCTSPAGASLTIHTALNWSGGGFNNGSPVGPCTVILPPDAVMNISGSVGSCCTTFELDGTTSWTAGKFIGYGPVTVNNRGLFLASSDSGFGYRFSTDVVFNNSGMFNRSGSGTSDLATEGAESASTFNNTGTVVVQSGTLQLGDGSSSGGFQIDTGATLEFLAQRTQQTLADGVTLVGAGLVRHGGGRLVLEGMVSASNLEVTALPNRPGDTRLSGGTNAIFNGGELTWTGGSIDGTLAVSAASLVEISGDGQKFMDGTIAFNGTTNWTGGLISTGSGVQFTNGGTFNDSTDVPFGGRDDANPTFNNLGTFSKAESAVVQDFASHPFVLHFKNSGTVNIPSGSINFGEYVQLDGVTEITDAVLAVPGEANPRFFGFLFDFFKGVLQGKGKVKGTIKNRRGNTIKSRGLFLEGNVSNAGRIESLGPPRLTMAGLIGNDGASLIGIDGGTLVNRGGGILIQGRLDNAGRLIGNDGGTRAGEAASIGPRVVPETNLIRVEGDFAQTAIGLLELGLADQLEVTGLATLDGTLKVDPPAGRATRQTTPVELVKFGSRSGDFVYDGLAQPGDQCFVPVFTATSLMLEPVDCTETRTTSLQGYAFLQGQTDHSGIEVRIDSNILVPLPATVLLISALAAGLLILSSRRRARAIAVLLAAVLCTSALAAVIVGQTNSSGRYSLDYFSGYVAGDYTLTFSKAGYVSQQATASVRTADSVSVAVANVTLAPVASAAAGKSSAPLD